MSMQNPVSQTFLPSSEAVTEEDAKNCYLNWSLEKESSLFRTCFGHNYPFKDENIARHYENFRIKNISRIHSVIWTTYLLLFLYGVFVIFTEYDNELWFMRIILILRLVIVVLALYNYVKILHRSISHESSRKEFHQYVQSVTNLSSFIVIAISMVNGAAYVWKSGLGSCVEYDVVEEHNIVNNQDTYFYDCNPAYETGGTPPNSMVLLIVGNIFVVVTLRCHSPWAARVNYFVMCLSCLAAAALSPDPGQSTLIILSSFLTVIIYEGVEDNSLVVFKALLELEASKRIQMSELKHFIGNVAHDLKTPLHGFSMCMDHLLLDSRDNLQPGPAMNDILQTIELCQANCSFMSSAINRTVDFAKSASNIALTAHIETTSIANASQWAATCVASTQSRIPIDIARVPVHICGHVVTDKHWFMENILCYLSNAVKYSSSGRITLSVSVEPTSEIVESHSKSPRLRSSSVTCDVEMGTISANSSQLMLCIAVEDEGIGVDSKKMSSLFKPFQQTMRLAGGTGLGLYSLAKRVEALKGKYGVSGRADGRPGSRFWFAIPYVPDEMYSRHCMDEDCVPHELTPSVREVVEPLDGVGGHDVSDRGLARSNFWKTREVVATPVVLKKVTSGILRALVIDDSAVICKSTARMLTKAGYTVEVAENGAVGLDKMKQGPYSIVIMDLQMPIMDGLEATRRYRSWEAHAAPSALGRKQQLIVGVSANGADDVQKAAIDCGMTAFMPKPFSVSKLIDFRITPVDVEDEEL